jgi:Protein of unknown function (DUF4231)
MVSPPDDPVPTTSSNAKVILEEALTWYDKQASTNRLWYQFLRLAAIILAATVPVLTTSGAPSLATAIVGALIVVAEGIQQVFRFHDNYTTYRATWNYLTREQRLHMTHAGAFANNPDPDRTLAEHIDTILAEENSNWTRQTTITSHR